MPASTEVRQGPHNGRERHGSMEAFSARLNKRIGELDEGFIPLWTTHFPSLNGHPSLGVIEKFPDQYPNQGGAIVLSVEGNMHHVTLWALQGEVVGRPHSMQSLRGDPQCNKKSQYSALQVRIDPLDQNFSLYGITNYGESIPLADVSTNDISVFAEICIKQIENKDPEKQPSVTV